MIFAEALPEANTLLQILVAGGFILWIAGMVKGLFSKTERREISFADEYASKAEFKALDRKVQMLEGRLEHSLELIRQEMKHDKEAILESGEERAIKLHDRINVVLQAVSELKGRIEK
ncbi:MAG: hypothetical protein ABS95_02455 [Verrucomicrobia bacterium SCN 57-15]|nr:MAG: hypothetical protein ABS95_02455 [Verrucomicrobia bacterium SCN 57-15]